MRREVSRGRAWHPPVDPGLEDQHVPELVAQVTTARPVEVPGPPNRNRVQETLVPEASLVQKVLGPRGSSPRSHGPMGGRTPSSAARRALPAHGVRDLAQQPLGPAAPQLGIEGQPPGQIEDPTIEERDAGLEGYRHGRSIELGQDVIGQITHEVGPEHLLGDPAAETGDPLASLPAPWSLPSTNERRIVPMGGQGPIGVLGVRGGEDPGQFATLVDGFRTCQPTGRTPVTRPARSITPGGIPPSAEPWSVGPRPARRGPPPHRSSQACRL